MIQSIPLPETRAPHLNTVIALMRDEHGEVPGYRAAASANGAGRILVAWLTRLYVTGARLGLSDSGKWFSTIRLDESPFDACVTDQTAPIVLLQAALYFGAGFAGECSAGVEHPCSSIPDRYFSNYCCDCLDRVLRSPENTFRTRRDHLLEHVLSHYFGEFSAIRTLLEEGPRISYFEIVMSLAGSRPLDLHEILGGPL